MTASPRRRRITYAILAVCAVLVATSLGLSAVTFVRQSQADTIRTADRKAQAVSQVATCRRRVEDAPKVVRILGLVDLLATNSIIANKEALATARPGDPLTPVRKASLRRLEPARDALRQFIDSTVSEAPTAESCAELAQMLGVEPRPKGRP